MPSIDQNLDAWSRHNWEHGGDEWSAGWGNVRMQWWGTLFPRIYPFLPAPTILEIAPGHGRFTQFLLGQCRRFVGVDIAENCVEACHRRFAGAAHASFFVNDGRAFPTVHAGSVDFAFSFDSLVHVDPETMRAYCHELRRVLAPDGVAFLHHSNLGAYAATVDLSQPGHNPHWRDVTMSADRMLDGCRDAGLGCIAQELLVWGGVDTDPLSDCLSVLTPPGSRFARPLRRWENPRFGAEVHHLGELARVYHGQAENPAIASA